jgi:hypothetical protein
MLDDFHHIGLQLKLFSKLLWMNVGRMVGWGFVGDWS